MTNEVISVGDVKTLINLIDVVAARGAFKGEEMLAVGQTRQRLVHLLELAQNQPTNSVELPVAETKSASE